jgi:hypothetical protein
LQKLNGAKEVDELINKSKLMLIEEQHVPISPFEVANRLNVGYSWFRKVFKEYTNEKFLIGNALRVLFSLGLPII